MEMSSSEMLINVHESLEQRVKTLKLMINKADTHLREGRSLDGAKSLLIISQVSLLNDDQLDIISILDKSTLLN